MSDQAFNQIDSLDWDAIHDVDLYNQEQRQVMEAADQQQRWFANTTIPTEEGWYWAVFGDEDAYNVVLGRFYFSNGKWDDDRTLYGWTDVCA